MADYPSDVDNNVAEREHDLVFARPGGPELIARVLHYGAMQKSGADHKTRMRALVGVWRSAQVYGDAQTTVIREPAATPETVGERVVGSRHWLGEHGRNEQFFLLYSLRLMLAGVPAWLDLHFLNLLRREVEQRIQYLTRSTTHPGD